MINIEQLKMALDNTGFDVIRTVWEKHETGDLLSLIDELHESELVRFNITEEATEESYRSFIIHYYSNTLSKSIILEFNDQEFFESLDELYNYIIKYEKEIDRIENNISQPKDTPKIEVKPETMTTCKCGANNFRLEEAYTWEAEIDEEGTVGASQAVSEFTTLTCTECHTVYDANDFGDILTN